MLEKLIEKLKKVNEDYPDYFVQYGNIELTDGKGNKLNLEVDHVSMSGDFKLLVEHTQNKKNY